MKACLLKEHASPSCLALLQDGPSAIRRIYIRAGPVPTLAVAIEGQPKMRDLK